ncbi:MAG TPA: protein kinase, partial [Pseudomonadota bacterium]|nr:protein kinase [Pseudomonadota bacterium]
KEYQAPTALVDLSKPAYRLGVAEIRVGTQAHQIDVKVQADKESYAVRAVEDGRPLLLKLLIWPGGPPELPQDELLDWKSGVQRLASFRHPSLSQTHALIPFDEEGRTCLLREPVELEGKTLPELLRSLGRPLRETEVQDLASQIGEALDAVHRLDLLHLGLSPRRIVVISDGDNWRVKLTDVGLYPKTLAARFAEPGYLAPEVLSGQACDPRSDQFSLAVILYELLAGQPAFVGAPDEPREVVVQRVLAEDPLPLLLSKRVELALQRALSRSRGVRFAHLRDFVAALGGSVSRFSPPTEGRVAALPRRPESTWPRLWLPMVQGALWAVCGLDFCSVRASFCFPKSRGRSHRRSSPRRRLKPKHRTQARRSRRMRGWKCCWPSCRRCAAQAIHRLPPKQRLRQPPSRQVRRFPNRRDRDRNKSVAMAESAQATSCRRPPQWTRPIPRPVCKSM